jgi:hypothetical protein
MLQFLPYAMAAYGGYRGYREAKKSGASGLGRLLGAAGGAYGGYTLGSSGLSALNTTAYNQFANMPFTQTLGDKFGMIPGMQQTQLYTPNMPVNQRFTNILPGEDIGTQSMAEEIAKRQEQGTGTNFLQKLLMRRKRTKEGELTKDIAYEIDPYKAGSALAALTYFGGAFKDKPQDVYMPTYNVDYATFAKERGPFKYIDPATGAEKDYESVYIPEANRPSNIRTFGPYEIVQSSFNSGGLAEIKKFNQGGVNYLPSKVSHNENDSNNYVRAHGYVEDGSGNGDKDEDTMLAQLADGEFVTRADGVLGAGILAGANPNSMKDMREKGAQYFYEQQKRLKRIFDLLEDKNGNNSTKN